MSYDCRTGRLWTKDMSLVLGHALRSQDILQGKICNHRTRNRSLPKEHRIHPVIGVYQRNIRIHQGNVPLFLLVPLLGLFLRRYVCWADASVAAMGILHFCLRLVRPLRVAHAATVTKALAPPFVVTSSCSVSSYFVFACSLATSEWAYVLWCIEYVLKSVLFL